MLKSPYPYFGGKSAVAADIWRRFGRVANYIEPFFGSGAVLLARPQVSGLELVNDLDGYIVNFWRAVQADPESVARYADYPAFESDLHARHAWLVGQKADLSARLEGDPDYYDARIAGWWVWGMALWIGGGFCSGDGPWARVNGRLVKTPTGQTGSKRQMPHLTRWQGIKRQRIELAALPEGVIRRLPELDSGRGIRRAHADGLRAYIGQLQERMARVRVTCGDWQRVMTPAVLTAKTPTAILLDPPYSHEKRDTGVYTSDDPAVYAQARAWAVANGDNPDYRIAYCAYEDGFGWPAGWTSLRWKTNGGYGNRGNGQGRANRTREVIYFSPHCLNVSQQGVLFDALEETDGAL